MKRLIPLFLILLGAGVNTAMGQWQNNLPHINNTNTDNVGIGTGAVWTPSAKLHINNGPNIAGVMTESSYTGTSQRAVGFFRIKNTATGDMFNMVLRKNGTYHEMLQSCYDASAMLWREYAYFNFGTRKYEMRNGINDAEFLNTGNFLVNNTGNVGIGTGSSLLSEKLHVNGAVKIGNTTNNNTGTIRWEGTHFQGYNGTAWVNFDEQPCSQGFISDMEHSTFITATTNYTVPSGYNFIISYFDMIDNLSRVTINGIQDICYYGQHESPVILSPGDQLAIVNGASATGQLITYKYETVYENLTNSSYTVPSGKNLVLYGVYADCFYMPITETFLLIVDGVTVGYLFQPPGMAIPLVINENSVLTTSNVINSLVISGYLVDN